MNHEENNDCSVGVPVFGMEPAETLEGVAYA
jgi:hypothetical protein